MIFYKMKHNERIKLIRTRRKRKCPISITVDCENLEKAKKLCEHGNVTISEMFDMFLEDFVYEQLEEKEQLEINKADIENLKIKAEKKD